MQRSAILVGAVSCLFVACGPDGVTVLPSDGGPIDDASVEDASAQDTSTTDAPAVDAGPHDAPAVDSGPHDTGADSGLAAACTASGGTVKTILCCASAGDYTATCGIGACTCAPTSSHDITDCQCPTGKCWNGTACK